MQPRHTSSPFRHLRRTAAVACLVLMSAAHAGELKLATTTSTENSGLLKYLLPRFEQKSGDTLIHGDITGDGKADFTIVLDTLVTLAASDFLL